MKSGSQQQEKTNPDQVRKKTQSDLKSLLPDTPTKPGLQPKPTSLPKGGGTISPSPGASSAQGSDDVADPAAEQPSGTAEGAAAKTAPAAKRAERMAESLKKTLGEGPGAMGGGGQQGKAGLSPSGAGVADPKTAQELAMASMTGFSSSFAALGLHAGKGPSGEASILRANGEPASAEELSKLKASIAAEPAALMRRPDFFKVLPREKFESLKESYRSKPALRDTDFKHIEMSAAERDFMRSASCDKLSGGCNPHTTQMSYRKGDFVPPEDLSNIQKHLQPLEDDPDLEVRPGEAAAEPKGAAFNGSAFDAIYAKLNGLIGSIKDTMGIGDTGKPAEPGAVSAGSGEAGWGGSGEGGDRTFAFSETGKARVGSIVPPASAAARPAARSRAAAAKRGRNRRLLGMGALPGVLFLLFAAARFRRKKSFLERREY